jgi:hypothetical protein
VAAAVASLVVVACAAAVTVVALDLLLRAT